MYDELNDAELILLAMSFIGRGLSVPSKIMELLGNEDREVMQQLLER